MSTQPSRSRKRAREDSGQAFEASVRRGPGYIKEEDEKPLVFRPLKRDEEFWFDDGTVILVAGDVEFRVYSGVLGKRSPVFKELFAQQHPMCTVSVNGLQDTVCPVVLLSDSSEDLRHFLRVFISQDDLSSYETKPPSYPVLSAHLRLGRKYQIASLYMRALRFLKIHYTHKWEVFASLTKWSPPGWYDRDAIGVVNLARLVNEPSILPFAFMTCGMLKASDLVHGIAREDGTRETLTAEDLIRCLDGRVKLRKASVAALHRTLELIPDGTCKQAGTCKGVLQAAVLGLSASIDTWMDDDPFSPFDAIVGQLALCDTCSVAIVDRNWEEHAALWRRLPEFFDVDVPGWAAEDALDNAANNASI